jgi:hypothetical protein
VRAHRPGACVPARWRLWSGCSGDPTGAEPSAARPDDRRPARWGLFQGTEGHGATTDRPGRARVDRGVGGAPLPALRGDHRLRDDGRRRGGPLPRGPIGAPLRGRGLVPCHARAPARVAAGARPGRRGEAVADHAGGRRRARAAGPAGLAAPHDEDPRHQRHPPGAGGRGGERTVLVDGDVADVETVRDAFVIRPGLRSVVEPAPDGRSVDRGGTAVAVRAGRIVVRPGRDRREGGDR